MSLCQLLEPCYLKTLDLRVFVFARSPDLCAPVLVYNHGQKKGDIGFHSLNDSKFHSLVVKLQLMVWRNKMVTKNQTRTVRSVSS